MRNVYAALLAVALLACSNKEDGGVLIGAVIDTSGSTAQPFWPEAVGLAVEHANAALESSEHSGLRFRLRLADSANDRTVALAQAQALKEAGATALVVDTTENLVALMETNFDFTLENDVRLPMVCMACTSSDLGSPTAINSSPAQQRALRNELRLAFRTVTGSRNLARLLLRHYVEALPRNGDVNGDGQQKIGVASMNDLDGQSFFSDLKTASTEISPGIRIEKIRHERGTNVDAHDWYHDLLRLTDDRNDALFGAADGQPDALMDGTYSMYAAALSRAYFEAGESIGRIPYIHNHFWRSDATLLKLSPYELEGAEGISYASLDNCRGSGAVFAAAFQDRTGRAPGLMHANAYDATMTVLLGTVAAMHRFAIEDAEVLTPTQLRDGIQSINDKSAAALKVGAGEDGFAAALMALRAGVPVDYQGASGPVDFDEYGNVTGNFIRYRVEEGRFVKVETFDCVADANCPGRVEVCPGE